MQQSWVHLPDLQQSAVHALLSQHLPSLQQAAAVLFLQQSQLQPFSMQHLPSLQQSAVEPFLQQSHLQALSTQHLPSLQQAAAALVSAADKAGENKSEKKLNNASTRTCVILMAIPTFQLSKVRICDLAMHLPEHAANCVHCLNRRRPVPNTNHQDLTHSEPRNVRRTKIFRAKTLSTSPSQSKTK